MAWGMADTDLPQSMQGTPSPKGTCNGLGEQVKVESREELYILPNSVITALVKNLND